MGPEEMIGPRTTRDLTTRFLAATYARELVARVVELLGPAGIEVMPLKGALLQAWVYPDPAERELVDVDLLVPPGRFAEAAARLREAGFEPRAQRMSHERSFLRRDLPLPVDLHARLFPPLRYDLEPRGLFERATADDELFGCPIRRAAPEDVLAHLIGHTTNNHADARTLGKYARDVELLCERGSLDAGGVAEHLHAAGLGRATRYALPQLAGPMTEDFVQAVVRRLPPDPLGVLLARGARHLIASAPPGARPGTLAAYLLGKSVGRAVVAAAFAGVDQGRYAASRYMQV